MTLPGDAWAQMRQHQCDQMIGQLTRMVLTNDFDGVKLAKGELDLRPEAFTLHGDAARYYERALAEECERMGVWVRKLRAVPGSEAMEVVDAKGAFVCAYEDEPVLNSMFMETVAMTGAVPGHVRASAAMIEAGIVEAVAEGLRILIGDAVVTAFEYGASEEDVIVIFHAGPDIATKTNLRTGNISALGRIRGSVYNQRDPSRSYLLGENVKRMEQKDKKPLQAVFNYMTVEAVYGPARVRWKDNRSAPVYESDAKTPALVVPS